MLSDGSAAALVEKFTDRKMTVSRNGQYRRSIVVSCPYERLILALANQNGVNTFALFIDRVA